MPELREVDTVQVDPFASGDDAPVAGLVGDACRPIVGMTMAQSMTEPRAVDALFTSIHLPAAMMPKLLDLLETCVNPLWVRFAP